MTRWATFDCYGTLVDWDGGIGGTLAGLWPEADRDALLARYHEIEPRVQLQPSLSYREVLATSLRLLADHEDLPLAQEDENALAISLPDWPVFADVPEALAELRRRGVRLAVLSNTDADLLAASLARIGVPVDATVTAADAGSYKPAPGHWERFFALSGAEPGGHVHVAASVYHDLEPAAALGLKAVWINRTGAESEAARTGELEDLSSLPDVVDRLVPPQGEA